MTKNTVQRVLVFFLGVPLLILLEVYVSFERNVLLALLVVVIQALAIGETSALFSTKNIHVNRDLIAILSVISSVIVYLSPLFADWLPGAPSPIDVLFSVSLIGSLVVIAPFVFAKSGDFAEILPGIASSLFVYFYCGVLGSCLVYITSCFGQYAQPVFTFVLLTLGNDSMAWLVGTTLGKKRGIVAVSPGKSLEGFIGGLSGSIIAALLSYFLFPESGFGSLLPHLLFGAVIGVCVIVGDLVESALKRSAGVKDSSSAVPGRGGVLDSCDSLLFSAPVFVAVSMALGFFQPPM
jgi:phosphatidate cytidylyltransferase